MNVHATDFESAHKRVVAHVMMGDDRARGDLEACEDCVQAWCCRHADVLMEVVTSPRTLATIRAALEQQHGGRASDEDVMSMALRSGLSSALESGLLTGLAVTRDYA